MSRKYDSALRPHLRKRLEEIEEADILIGIPCLNNEDTIVHVIQAVSHGLFRHFREMRSVIMVADGGSTDDTRDQAREFEMRPWQEKVVTIYRGIGGKGSALRSIFEAAYHLKARACACVDSDLRSINPEWMRYLLDPVLEADYEFVAPIYSRYKYDGTITNNIVYNLVRAVYGKRIRQPIGGDFAFSQRLVRHYLDQEVWATDIARFGIDIWMTLNAVVEEARICQANLGVKVHDAKDPAEALGPMFRQVCGTIFSLMEQHQPFWEGVTGSQSVPVFGGDGLQEPAAIEVNQPRMVLQFQEGIRLFGPLYRGVFSHEVAREIERAADLPAERFHLQVQTWVKLVYELAAKYHHLQQHRMKLLGIMTPLYLGRVASFINDTRDMSSQEAEEVVQEQAQVFEELKPYLVKVWEDEPHSQRAGEGLAKHS